MKPILNVLINPKHFRHSSVIKTFKSAIYKLFNDKYEVVFTPYDTRLVVENSTVVNLELSYDNIELVVEKLKTLASGANTVSPGGEGI